MVPKPNAAGAVKEKPVASRSDKVNLAPAPRLTRAQRDHLAAQFREAVPDCEVAMANLQGLLMNFKSNPAAVVPAVPRWVEERSARRERNRAKKETEGEGEGGGWEGEDGRVGRLSRGCEDEWVNKLSDSDSQK